MVLLPLFKLGILGIRHLSRPVSVAIRSEAKKSRFFRKYICIPPAQFYHYIEVRAKLAMLKLGRHVEIKPLNEAAAIELGAEILGELLIFLVAVGALILESQRQKSNNEKKFDPRPYTENARKAVDYLQMRLAENNAHLEAAKETFKEMGQPIKFEMANELNVQKLEELQEVLSKY